MHFISLRLSGFKSFVDPTELVIAPGLTGVVGPNGCGKSNLLEALRWVMGESRSSVMRGAGMEDVIFAGAASRPARNHAEVALRLDNSERRAPVGFNDDDRLEVVRRIVRDAGSAYRANGREVRARDVQMLFADASTGAQSPSLVRQGQIAELINARPKARRRVLEEAAGISGLYQRRHEAELKLAATETNLGRVADLLEALESQLAALARQARQAARYRAIAEALRRAEALLLLRSWHDAESARIASSAAQTDAARAAARAQAEAAEAARLRDAAETAMPARREEDAVAAAILQRIRLEQERLAAESVEAARRIAGLEAAARQVAADRAREAALDRDAAETAARLADEGAALARAEDGHAAALAAARGAATKAGATLDAVQADFDVQTEAVARLAAEHHAAGRALKAAQERVQTLATVLARAQAAHEAASAEAAAAQQARAVQAVRAAETAAAVEAAEAEMARAETASAAARSAEVGARAALAEAEGAARALASEAAGLERLLARPPGAAAQMLDAVRVEPGFEAALGAALGEDLALPALEDEAGSGWAVLPPCPDAPPLPRGAARLAERVVAPPALARRLAAVALVARAEGAELQASLTPGQRAVSREGDLWRWDGLRIEAGAQPSGAAMRLQQRNRLEEVAALRVSAEAVLAEARAAQAKAAEEDRAAAAAEAAARAERRRAEQAAAEAARAAARAQTTAEALDAQGALLAKDCTERAEALEAARAALNEAERAAAALANPSAARAGLDATRLQVEAARLAMLTRRAEAAELEREGTARVRRLAEIAREGESWRKRAETAAGRLGDLDQRAERTAATLETAQQQPEALAERRRALAAAATAAEARRVAAADALGEAEAALRATEVRARAAERAGSEAREALARAQALAEAAAGRAEAAEARLRGEAEAAPEALLARYDMTTKALPAADALEAEAAGLRRQRDGMGAVNLRAEEDARAVAGEAETLARERADLEAAVAKLRQGIGALNREGRGRLLAAFEAVNRNFGALFAHLFGGGEAALVLVESDDPLEAGLEIMCQPPGKKLSTLSLLSGGEQTLTALSLIFAVFLANPSPICVLDEVDAPLDDANVARFCDLLDEMTARTRTRFLVITHHAVTMARMDRLFGVTMAEPGVSQLVSVDLAGAEGLVGTEAEPVA